MSSNLPAEIDDLNIPTVLDNLPENYTAIFKNRYSLTNYKGGGIAIIFHEIYAEHCDVVKLKIVLYCMFIDCPTRNKIIANTNIIVRTE